MKNPVAKHMRAFNKSTIQANRKKAIKLGYLKHKGDYYANSASKRNSNSIDYG